MRKIMYFVVALPLVLILFGFLLGIFISAPAYKGQKSAGFNGKQFTNYDNIKAKGLRDVVKWAVNRERGEWDYVNDPPKTVPNATEENLTIYFVNHATFLIQWQGINILTDPIWSKRTSPFSFVGPQRMRPPGIDFENLPDIHLIIISHNHYDHLDIPTIKKLWPKNKPEFIVPLGVDLFLQKFGIENVKALNWWEETNLKSIDIEMVPAQHFSGRGMLDRDKTLWGGYILKSKGKTLYFAGDTGYNSRMFDDISEKHPEIDVALLPVGAYKPKWFMSPIHISPDEAVKIHRQLNIRQSIGMHFGTFPLADDGQKEPSEGLKEALKNSDVSKEEFLLPEEGSKIDNFVL